jgi:hypothetical protein
MHRDSEYGNNLTVNLFIRKMLKILSTLHRISENFRKIGGLVEVSSGTGIKKGPISSPTVWVYRLERIVYD